MIAQAATSSAKVARSPPCIIPGAPWYVRPGVIRETTASPSRSNARCMPIGWLGPQPKHGWSGPNRWPSSTSVVVMAPPRAL